MNIESRVARLETENRLLKGVALLALAVSVLPWMMGSDAAIQDHVQARQFTLIGSHDAPAGLWAFDQQTETATFSIQSSQPSRSVVLEASGDHATVRLLNGVKRPPPAVVPRAGKLRAHDGADIALTTGNHGTAIDVKEGSIEIEREGKTAFVAPPRAAFLPVTQK